MGDIPPAHTFEFDKDKMKSIKGFVDIHMHDCDDPPRDHHNHGLIDMADFTTLVTHIGEIEATFCVLNVKHCMIFLRIL